MANLALHNNEIILFTWNNQRLHTNIIKMMTSSKMSRDLRYYIERSYLVIYFCTKFHRYSLASSEFKNRNLSMAQRLFILNVLPPSSFTSIFHDPLYIFLYIPPKPSSKETY